MKVTWVDREREPQHPSNPAYPNGQDIDVSQGAPNTCSTAVPYPAKRCGLYVIQCEDCGLVVAFTTAGRPDDPRTVKVACKNQPRLQ